MSFIFAGKPFNFEQMKRKENPKTIVNLVSHEEAFSYDFGDNREHRILLEKVIDDYDSEDTIVSSNFPYSNTKI